MPWNVLAAAVGAYGAYAASKKQKEAAEAAAAAERRDLETGIAWQKEMYADIRPFLLEGMQRYKSLLERPEAFTESPGYMFRLKEGLKAAGIAEGDRYLSGSQIKAATRYGQEYASGEYQAALNRAAGLTQVAQGVGAAGAPFTGEGIYGRMGAAAGEGIRGAGAARASGYIGMSRAAATGLSSYGAYSRSNTSSDTNDNTVTYTGGERGEMYASDPNA